MLEVLSIKNVAIIDSVEISFKKGLNILSGETGAGKSIVIDAISLLLGSRADVNLIRSGAEEASVEGLFQIADMPQIGERLAKLGYQSENAELLIKRVVNRNGKHRIYVNGELGTLALLQDLCEGLVDLCGQHEHQSLLKAQTQLELIDRYGGLLPQTSNLGQLLQHHRSLHREHDILSGAETERLRRLDYLKFQISEIQAAQIEPGEDEKLQAQKQLLQSAEQRVRSADAVVETLDREQDGVLDMLRSALTRMRTLNQLDAELAPVREGLERALAESEETSMALQKYLRSVDVDSERLTQIQERLSLLADLKKKYGGNLEDVLKHLARLESELNSIGEANERVGALTKEIQDTREKLQTSGKGLSKSRKKVASMLSESVTAELKDLKMGDAEFSTELTYKEEIDNWSLSGPDQIQFLVKTNRGEPARPMGKIVSGGELSRLMLAIRRVISDRGGIGVYLFDEIDAGIGGQTAFKVGKKLKSVAEHNQVICITHVPQVASFADHHLSVRKSQKGERTTAQIVEIEGQERKKELARMLGGPELTQKSLDNAAELLELAR
ncbi:DNA repair protein RecN [bacterium]|nr:DNA repair protein RecN [bacterium]